MLKNFQKVVPSMKLSDMSDQKQTPVRTYAQVARSTKPNGLNHHGLTNQRRQPQYQQSRRSEVKCWNCGVPGHTRDVCRFQEPILAILAVAMATSRDTATAQPRKLAKRRWPKPIEPGQTPLIIMWDFLVKVSKCYI
jgi:hypothetical protein